MIELRIQGQAVDVAPDTKITLNFNSNIFGDISKITPSNSLTITLPKTPKNAKVFGAPSIVGGSFIAPYSRWSAELYVNGVAVVDTAYAVLLSVGESYEIALYWGVVTALSTLKDNDKTLADISKVLEIKYGGDKWWENWEGTPGNDIITGETNRGLLNAVYESGIEDLRNNATARAQVALLPSVKASWLWDNIVADNGLNIVKPSAFTTALGKLALPFTTRKVNVETMKYETRYLQATRVIVKRQTPTGSTIEEDERVVFYNVAQAPSTNDAFTMVNAEVKLSILGSTKYRTSTVYKALVDHTCIVKASVKGKNETTYHPIAMLYKYYAEEDKWEVEAESVENVKAEIDIKAGDMIALVAKRNPKRWYIDLDSATISFAVTEGETDAPFGTIINTADNLPTIKQLDFVKAMCAMYGLWATLVDGVVYLVRFSDLYAQTPLDWSHKLVGTGDGDAGKTTYTLADYAQRNILRYKEDDTVKVDASGALIVDNENLDKEKEMFTLPFSASDGNVIPHLKWKDDDSTTGEVEEEKVEPRIMKLVERFSTNSSTATLSFDGLKFSQLIPEYYSYWQKVMRNPIVIEEKVRLSEIDIKMLDFRKPIYLQKYGATFAIDKVQWSEGGPSTVTLVKLPPAQSIGVALPYTVTTGVAFSGSNGVEDNLSYLVSGAGEYFAESATIRFDEVAGERMQLSFLAWKTPGGRTISTDNPYIYDGSNGDLDIIAYTDESAFIG
ncbi:MAG: hypothetical protein IIV16_03335 [Alistipes sp.]|nr:hypothetical protein [Alistipes sp.]